MLTLDSTASSLTSSFSCEGLSTPPSVMVPDEELDAPMPTHRPSAGSRLLRQFKRIDLLKLPSSERRRIEREEREKSWHSVVEAQLSPSHADLVAEILDDPLMAVGRRPVGGGGKKSPGARLLATIHAAVKDKRRATTTYLTKPAVAGACSIKPKTPPAWRRSARSPRFLQQAFAQREAAKATEAAKKQSRWAAAIKGSMAADGGMPRSGTASVSFANDDALDALDQFMQQPARVTTSEAAGVPASPPRSDLQALCRARRRQVLIEMGCEEADLHPSLRGYAAPRREAEAVFDAHVGGDSLDLLICGRA